MKRLLSIALLLIGSLSLSAQQIYGTTGLLVAPSGEMQTESTVMIGANWLSDVATPDGFPYSTINYYFNVTLFSFVELVYAPTLFRGSTIARPGYVTVSEAYKDKIFCNQDRSFSARFRLCREHRIMPSLVIGINDIYSQTNDDLVISEGGAQYFNRLYLAATKHFELGHEDLGVHLGYTYSARFKNPLNSITMGVTYNPSFYSDLRFLAEFYNGEVNVGMNCDLFDIFRLHAMLQDWRYFSGGLCIKFRMR